MRFKLEFKKCIQNSQDYGSTDEHMVSRVFFDLYKQDKFHQTFCVDIKQTVGGNYETDSIEIISISPPLTQTNYLEFQKCVEKYYRSLVGSSGQMINIKGATNVRMRNNTIYKTMICEFDVEESSDGW